jgi:hypothetical protein
MSPPSGNLVPERGGESVESRAIRSLLDVVEELAQGLAHGATPETDWSQLVADTFARHRREPVAGEPEPEPVNPKEWW